MHAVHRLFNYRKSLSTKEFNARGQKINRCESCRISIDFCICHLSPTAESNVSFLLLMYDTEVLKPSNTGRLIADVIPDCHAFLWSRTEPDPKLLALLKDDKWQPFVVFPKEYAEEGRQIVENKVMRVEGKRPLFIMLDGSWREAKKMFRKSEYLSGFPIISFDPSTLVQKNEGPRYIIRKTKNNNQLATAEVAARVLSMAGEERNSQLLDLWFDVFISQYQKSIFKSNQGNINAIEDYNAFRRLI